MRKPPTAASNDKLLALVETLRAEISALTLHVLQQDKVIADLRQELAAAKKNSSNSSKPPSSDIAKPPKQKSPRKRKHIGAQPGHQRHSRSDFSADEINQTIEYALELCPHCGGHLIDDGLPLIVQQAELVENPIMITEHRATPKRCTHCGERIKTVIPSAISAGGLCGPRLTSFAAFLKGGCHASTTTVQAVFTDVLNLPVSTGFIMKMLQKVTNALEIPYETLLMQLPEAGYVNADETGHKENGGNWWTWVFHTALFTLFRIADSRGCKVLEETLGPDFAGFLGADYFCAYRKFIKTAHPLVQFCLAHLLRDVRFLCESPDKITANYGLRLLVCLRRLFNVWHRKALLTPEGFQRRLEEERDRLLAKVLRAPARKEAQNMANRFHKHRAEYFRFIDNHSLEPTNNAAEQAIRYCVIDRRITQGTRGKNGRAWCERIWTASATCAQQGRSLFDYLEEAVTAYFNGSATPALLITP